MGNSFFQALDIIHIWADMEKLPVSITRNEILVSCTTDLSSDAGKVCHFISFILKRHWSYRTVSENDEYIFIFYENDERKRKIPSNMPQRKRRNDSTTAPQIKTLFD